MANIDNLDILINHIEAEDLAAFHMRNWTTSTPDAETRVDLKARGAPYCSTVACIGGTAEMIMKSRPGHRGNISEHHVAEWLGINSPTADELFYATSFRWDESTGDRSLRDITKPMALAALRDLRDMGLFKGWTHYENALRGAV